MYLLFLWEVVKRAFTPAPRVTDILQILAASTLPAASKFAGVKLPVNAGDDALAYIGVIAITFLAIRLLWAPYALWKEQGAEIGTLKLELTKPERLILAHLAKLQASARMKLSERLYQMHLCTFGHDKDAAIGELAKHCHHVSRLAHSGGLPREFLEAAKVFDELCEMRICGTLPNQEDFEVLDQLQRYLLVDPKGAPLALRLPEGIEPRTRP